MAIFWLTPQDPEGLIELMGGEEIFTQKLDSLFTISSELDDNASVDISGMIGQYAHCLLYTSPSPRDS